MQCTIYTHHSSICTCTFVHACIRFTRISDITHHLITDHNITLDTETRSFDTFEEFVAWKSEEERKTCTTYIQKCGSQTYSTGQHWYFYCNRAGQHTSKSRGIRSLKTQGSCKTGTWCTAHIKAVQNNITGKVDITFCHTHQNHELQLGHLRIQPSTRQNIAAQLQQGVAINRIMDNIREDISQGINRDHLISKQDVRNIQHCYNIEGISRHANDLTSVCSWVEELSSLPYNPVLVFKPQGTPQLPSMENISVNDFVLGIQTEFQRDMLKKFGNSCICMDGTHGTNVYDFNLITILVIDEYGEGIPVAWLLANREDSTVLMEFLKEVRRTSGYLAPKWFMSDDADQFFNAWSGVFGKKGTKKILCSWHVDRSWRKAILLHIKDKETQIQVYHHLRILLTERVESQFRVYLQQFLTIIQGTSAEFLQYFRKHYCSKTEQWALCYRAGTQVNTNMFIESFHRLLKVVYMEHKQNRRVDFLLHMLLKISRDKLYDRLQKVEKGKNTHRMTEINKRHKSAESMVRQGIQASQSQNGYWTVPSEAESYLDYMVRKLEEHCKSNCKVVCGTCNACIHLYTCTCTDFLIHNTVCKHIHLVHMSQNTCVSETDSTKFKENEITYFTELTTRNIITHTSKPQQGHVHIQSIIEQQLLQLNTDIKTMDMPTLRIVAKHLQSAISIGKAMNANKDRRLPPLPVKRKIASNAKIEKQLHFFSTKKKRQKNGHYVSAYTSGHYEICTSSY